MKDFLFPKNTGMFSIVTLEGESKTVGPIKRSKQATPNTVSQSSNKKMYASDLSTVSSRENFVYSQDYEGSGKIVLDL